MLTRFRAMPVTRRAFVVSGVVIGGDMAITAVLQATNNMGAMYTLSGGKVVTLGDLIIVGAVVAYFFWRGFRPPKKTTFYGELWEAVRLFFGIAVLLLLLQAILSPIWILSNFSHSSRFGSGAFGMSAVTPTGAVSAAKVAGGQYATGVGTSGFQLAPGAPTSGAIPITTQPLASSPLQSVQSVGGLALEHAVEGIPIGTGIGIMSPETFAPRSVVGCNRNQ